MAFSVFPIFILIVVIGIAVGIPFLISLFSGGKKEEPAPEAGAGSMAMTALFVILGVLGLLGVGVFVIRMFAAQDAPLRNAQVIVPPSLVEPATIEADGSVTITSPGKAFAGVPDHRNIQLTLRGAPDSSGSDGRFILEISNPTNKPFSPATLQELAQNTAWYVHVEGGTDWDSVNWDEKEFKQEIAPGQKAAFQIQIPFETVGAKSGSTILIYYQHDPDTNKTAVRSNPVTIP